MTDLRVMISRYRSGKCKNAGGLLLATQICLHLIYHSDFEQHVDFPFATKPAIRQRHLVNSLPKLQPHWQTLALQYNSLVQNHIQVLQLKSNLP